MALPDCMMPDGAEPCGAYRALQAELARVREERDELRALLDEAQAEHERLRNAIGYALSVGQVVGGSKQLLRAAIAGEGVKG